MPPVARTSPLAIPLVTHLTAQAKPLQWQASAHPAVTMVARKTAAKSGAKAAAKSGAKRAAQTVDSEAAEDNADHDLAVIENCL